MGNPRVANGARRRRLRARVAARGEPCAICGRPIDYGLPAFDPWSYELDEIDPVRNGGSPTDPRNVQPVHRRCNWEKYLAETGRSPMSPTPPDNASTDW